jgi:aspartyl/asparaginyl beta-hydroxylase (cupin superfamily)
MTTSELAAALGRLGGRSTSPAKVAAVRINLELARKSRWTKPRMVTEEAVRRAAKNAEHHARTEMT